MEVKGSYRSLANRIETLMESLSPAEEVACFEAQLKRMETDLREMQLRADSWARGYIDEFKGLALPGSNEDPCVQLVYGSSEEETIEELRQEVDALWLQTAQAALATNQTTFAVLNISDLLSENGLMAQLKAKGYEVREP